MKKILLLVILMIFSLTIAQAQPLSKKEEMNLGGPVKSVIEIDGFRKNEYDFSEKGLLVKKHTEFDFKTHRSRHNLLYDGKERMVKSKIIVILPNGEETETGITSESEISYDDKNKIYQVWQIKKNEKSGFISGTLTNEGKKLREDYLLLKNDFQEYRYNSSSQLIKQAKFDKNGVPKSKTEFKYDVNGRLEEVQSYSWIENQNKWQLRAEGKNKYDNLGRALHTIRKDYLEKDTLIDEVEFEYTEFDSYGNWTKRVDKSFYHHKVYGRIVKASPRTITREITYYEE